MAWIRLTADFDWKPRPSVTIALLSGQVRNVTRACAAAAVAKGKAVRMVKRSRYAEPVEASTVEMADALIDQALDGVFSGDVLKGVLEHDHPRPA